MKQRLTTDFFATLIGKGSPNYAPAVDSGVVFSAAADDNLYALDATTGALKWSYSPHTSTSSMSSVPAVGNGEVFVVAYHGLG